MVDFIGTDLSKPFQIFGESDELYRIKGGSSALINALVAALKDKADLQLGHALTELDTKEGRSYWPRRSRRCDNRKPSIR